VSLLIAGCQQNVSPEIDVQRVLFDGDMAHEDYVALLFLLQHPSADVQSVTIAGTGEVHCEPGVRYTSGVLAAAEQEDIPVACGRETPLTGDHEFPSAWRAQADEFYGVQLLQGGEPYGGQAADLIAETLRASEQPSIIVAVGPLTNIAEALQIYPDIVQHISRIYIMGGAVEVDGNVGMSGVGIDNAFAEWNIYIDPHAANVVLESGVPITLVALDATQDVPITTGFVNQLNRQRETPEADLVYELLNANRDLIEFGGFQFWDTLTAAVSLYPDAASYEDINLTVVEDEGPESGRTQPAADGALVQVATSAERRTFEALLLDTLNHP
jgi:pyrimidine-specific ribonucleoside hydrolase